MSVRINGNSLQLLKVLCQAFSLAIGQFVIHNTRHTRQADALPRSSYATMMRYT